MRSRPAPAPHATRHPRWASLLVIALAACSAQPGAIPTGGQPVAPTAPPAAPATPRSTPTPAPADVAGACALERQTFIPPSVRLENVEVRSTDGTDRITFTFGSDNQPTEPSFIESAEPPFPEGQSNNPVDVEGDDFLRILFRNMLQPPATGGEEVFVGDRDIQPDLPAVRHVIVTDESEGVMEFIVGYVGGGCASLDVDEKGGTVTVEVAHGT